ncbi:hypothetical protein HAX54_029084 [Datura stramonium]|uniref:VQ domain-containing protein n=1 Tax=Datura stramonium TaxID=4076 RepID=A0ABS8V7Z3_DATST|nr:hypothetical protein [Datura stramonium]
MASTSNHIAHKNSNQHNVGMNMSCNYNNGFEYSSNSNNTTFVQADPSNFRSVVQKLTGHESSSSSHKLPVGKSNSGEKGGRSTSFKLHERRHSARKLENIILTGGKTIFSTRQQRSSFLASPVSPLEMLTRGISPKSPMEEEDRAIAEKGFYLHPSTPRV